MKLCQSILVCVLASLACGCDNATRSPNAVPASVPTSSVPTPAQAFDPMPKVHRIDSARAAAPPVLRTNRFSVSSLGGPNARWFRIYHGTNSGVYFTMIEVPAGFVFDVAFSHLRFTQNFFAATMVDTGGQESVHRSNVAVWPLYPPSCVLITATPTNAPVMIEWSTDFRKWHELAPAPAIVQIDTPRAFFRGRGTTAVELHAQPFNPLN